MTDTPDDRPKAGKRLCLRAEDPDDLKVIAACLQDALVPLREMAYMSDERRFMAAFNRFQWERLDDPGDVDDLTSSHSALCIDHVDAIQYRGIDGELDGVRFELLTIITEPVDAGGHKIDLLFAGEVVLRLQVSNLAVTLQDFGETWAAGVAPHHDLSDIPTQDS